MENENPGISSIKQKISVEFEYLPNFCSFILHNAFEAFIDELLNLYRASDVPIFRYFKNMDADHWRAITSAATRDMLTRLASNQGWQYIDQTINNWLSNQFPLFTREQVNSQDITLINFAKGKALRLFIPKYTNDLVMFGNLVDEIDRFVTVFNSQVFASYLQVQKEEISKMNTALEKREKQLLEAQQIGQVGSFEWDFVTKKSVCTPQMFKIFEIEDLDDLSSLLSAIHPDDRERVHKAIQDALELGDYDCECRYIRNKREKVIHSKGKVQFEIGRPVRIIGTVTDETERHQIIQQLQESEKNHKQAQAITHLGNWSWVVNENTMSWSDEMYRIYGLEPQSETITLERFVSFVHPEDREDRIAQIRNSLETLHVDEYHFRINTAKGEMKVLRGKGEVIAGKDNKPVALLGTCQDVTGESKLTQQLRDREKYLEQLNASLKTANQELSRSNEELESFNFIASHDLQEPLRKIQVYSNRIIENGIHELPPILQDYFSRINNASRRMQKLIEDFLLFAQTLNSGKIEEMVDLNNVVEEIRTELVTRIEEKKATITVSPLPTIYAVPFQMKQLMVNLISNSLKYTSPDVPPVIKITGDIVHGSQIKEAGANKSISYSMICVSDNGIGFEPKYSAKIFELFQRLHSKNVYSGTGIGLALCKKIVQNLGGLITAESQPGKGATFKFYLPYRLPEKSVAQVESVEGRNHSR
jgi:signal transduction histidine kinase